MLCLEIIDIKPVFLTFKKVLLKIKKKFLKEIWPNFYPNIISKWSSKVVSL